MHNIYFPTELHRRAIEAITKFFQQQKETDTVLVTNSIARGKATPESDIDMTILVSEQTTVAAISAMETNWLAFMNSDPVLLQFTESSRFSHIHLDIIDGIFIPTIWETGAITDYYEVEIGNRIVYSAPMGEAGAYFNQLKTQYLPYYADGLRLQRLQMVKDAISYDLDRIPMLLERGLHFHAFDTLYRAFQEFLQALFIKNKVYPIAYNKWIKEQVAGVLNMPDLYTVLPQILSVSDIESNELNDKALQLKKLTEVYC